MGSWAFSAGSQASTCWWCWTSCSLALTALKCLRRLRSVSKIPVLLLTARGEDVDRIVAWRLGLTTIFQSRSIRGIGGAHPGDPATAKPSKSADAAPEILSVGDVELDPATRNVYRAGAPVELTSVEFNLLEVLLREAGRVVTRERLVNAVLSRKFMPFDRSIDMHVSKVRRKLGTRRKAEIISRRFEAWDTCSLGREQKREDEKPLPQNLSVVLGAQALFLCSRSLWLSLCVRPRTRN